MIDNLEIALGRVLAHEGGYVNHPADPGGATNRGVTQRVYDAYRKRQGEAPRSVRAITADEVADIYKRQYWDAVKGDDLPSGLDYAVFDYAVNSGPGRAIKDLQRELGVAVDGQIGNVTLAAAKSADVFDLIERLCARRMRFLKSLRHWGTFGKGWTSRVNEVIDGAVAMASGQYVVSTKSEPTPKGDEPARVMAQSTTLQATAFDLAAKAGAGIAAITALDGTVQLAVLALIGVTVIASLVIFRERIKAWADGWQ